MAVKPQPPVVEERRAEQRLQQVVGQAHAPEEGHAVQRPAEPRPAVPQQDDRRNDRRGRHQVAHRLERYEPRARDAHGQQPAPDASVLPFVVEEPVAAGQHAQYEHQQRLRAASVFQSPAERTERAVEQAHAGALGEGARGEGGIEGLHAFDAADRERMSAEILPEFERLDEKQGRDDPHPSVGELADGNHQQPEKGVVGQYVAVVDRRVDQPDAEQQHHAPCEAQRKVVAPLCLVVALDEEAQPEQQCEDGVHLARKQESQHIGHGLFPAAESGAGQVEGAPVEVEMLAGVKQDDPCHGDAAQCVGHFDTGVGSVCRAVHGILRGLGLLRNSSLSP